MFPKETHILVVDDSYNIRQIMHETLSRLGFTKIVMAEDAQAAYKKLQFQSESPNPFNLILSDLNMSGPSGIDFLKQVRKSAKFKDLPFVLVTTESERGAVIEAAVNGVSSYVVKPFNASTLTVKLQEAWDKHYGPKAEKNKAG